MRDLTGLELGRAAIKGRTQETERMYEKKAAGLMRRCRAEHGSDVSSEDFAAWLESMSAEWRPATVSLYRAAVAFVMEKAGHREIAQRVRDIRPTGHADGLPCRTSSGKARGMRRDTLGKVLAVLRKNNRASSDFVARWLVVGIKLGLRPGEYATAQIIEVDEKNCVITCHNAKSTNGRGNGKSRTLMIDRGEPLLPLIKSVIDEIQTRIAAGEDYAQIYENVARTLRRAVDRAKLKGKHPTLYSLRHQFATDLRRDHRDNDEIAALMGHLSDQTNLRYYGQRGSGGGAVVHAVESERATVRVHNDRPRVRENITSLHDAKRGQE